MKSLLTPDRNLPSLSQPRPNDNPERAYNLLLEESQKAYEPCGKSESIAARPQVNSLIKDSIRQQFQQPAVSKLRSAKRRGQRALQYFEISFSREFIEYNARRIGSSCFHRDVSELSHKIHSQL